MQSCTETLFLKCLSCVVLGNEGFLHGGGSRVCVTPFIPDSAGLFGDTSHALCR